MSAFQVKRFELAAAHGLSFEDTMTPFEKLVYKTELINRLCDMASSLERKETNKPVSVVCKAVLSKSAKFLEGQFPYCKQCNDCHQHAAEEKAVKKAAKLEQRAELKLKREFQRKANYESYMLSGTRYSPNASCKCDKCLRPAAEEKAANKAAKEAAKLEQHAKGKALRAYRLEFYHRTSRYGYYYGF